MFLSYVLTVRGRYTAAVGPSDPRPLPEILADLHALPREQLLGLRTYVLDHSNLQKRALDLMGQLLPEGHRQFLIEALETRGWSTSAIQCLAEMDDATVVDPILDRVKHQSIGALAPLARLSNPGFLAAVRRRHAAEPTEASAFVLGCYGLMAESEIRACAAAKDGDRRRWALSGLSLSQDKGSLPLLLELADLSRESEWRSVANRFVSEGEVHVPKLLVWLDGSKEQERVAAYALARIKSDVGVARVLSRYQDTPLYEPPFSDIAGWASRSGPKAAWEFATDRLAHGTPLQKLNALRIARTLKDNDGFEPGKEHPLLKHLLQATHDPDIEVRYQAARLVREFGYDAQYPEGRKVLRRLVEMMRDPAPRVRGEAAGQASQYPSPEVLVLLKRMAADKREDPQVRDSANRAAKSLEESLRTLPGRGGKPVFLRGGGSKGG